MRLSVFGTTCLLAALAMGCGGDEAAAGDPGGGSAGASGSTALFPDAPSCDSGYTMFRGTLDGSPIDQREAAVSNLTALGLQVGVGLSDGNTFGWAFETYTDPGWVKGEKRPFGSVSRGMSYWWVPEGHPLASTYLCISAGEIAPSADAPAGHVVFQWHITGLRQGTMPASFDNYPGSDCGGADLPVDLWGCIDRDTPYFP